MPKLSVGVWTKIKLHWMSFELDVYFPSSFALFLVYGELAYVAHP